MADKPSFLDAFEAAGNTLLQAFRDAFGYVRSNGRFLGLQCMVPFVVVCAAGYWLATQGVQADALPDGETPKPSARSVFGSFLASAVVGLVYLPFLVACHSLVLFGRDSIGRGIHLKFGRTEGHLLWASLRLMALGFIVLAAAGFVGGLIAILLTSTKVVAGMIIAALTVFATIAYLALTILIVPVVVSGDPKPVRAAFRLALDNKMLMVMFMIVAFVLRLIANGLFGFVGRLLPLSVGGVSIGAVILTSAVTVLGTAFGALMLSLIFLKVHGTPRATSSAPDPALAPLV